MHILKLFAQMQTSQVNLERPGIRHLTQQSPYNALLRAATVRCHGVHNDGSFASKAFSAVLATIMATSALPAAAAAAPWSSHLASEQLYEQQVQRHKPGPSSRLPTSREAEAMLSYDQDLFTDEAWQGMVKYVARKSRLQPSTLLQAKNIPVWHQLLPSKGIGCWQRLHHINVAALCSFAEKHLQRGHAKFAGDRT